MTPTHLNQSVVAALKGLLRERKRTYAELAADLGVSVATIKRKFQNDDFTFVELLRAAAFAGVSIQELFERSLKSQPQYFRFSTEQEVYFAAHPHYLGFLFTLQKHEGDLKATERSTGLKAASVNAYVKRLSEMKLLERGAPHRVHVLIRGSIQWDDDGPLGRVFSRKLLREFAIRLQSKMGEPGGHALHLLGFSLSERDHEHLKNEVEELIAKYRRISNLNRSLARGPGIRHLSALWASDFWDSEAFYETKDLVN